MHLCNLGTVEPQGSELSPIDWGFEYHSRAMVRARRASRSMRSRSASAARFCSSASYRRMFAAGTRRRVSARSVDVVVRRGMCPFSSTSSVCRMPRRRAMPRMGRQMRHMQGEQLRVLVPTPHEAVAAPEHTVVIWPVLLHWPTLPMCWPQLCQLQVSLGGANGWLLPVRGVCYP